MAIPPVSEMSTGTRDPWCSSTNGDDWASYADVRGVLKEVRKVGFSVAENRTQGLYALDSLVGAQLVGPKRRFPLEGIYFNIDSPQFSALWSRFRSLLRATRMPGKGLPEVLRSWRSHRPRRTMIAPGGFKPC